jgi:hypothetical protein
MTQFILNTPQIFFMVTILPAFIGSWVAALLIIRGDA